MDKDSNYLITDPGGWASRRGFGSEPYSYRAARLFFCFFLFTSSLEYKLWSLRYEPGFPLGDFVMTIRGHLSLHVVHRLPAQRVAVSKTIK